MFHTTLNNLSFITNQSNIIKTTATTPNICPPWRFDCLPTGLKPIIPIIAENTTPKNPFPLDLGNLKFYF